MSEIQGLDQFGTTRDLEGIKPIIKTNPEATKGKPNLNMNIGEGETTLEGVVWEQRNSPEWKKIGDEDKYRVYIDVPPEQYEQAVKITHEVVTDFDKPVKWKYVKKGEKAAEYIRRQGENKLVVICANEEEAKQFAEAFVNHQGATDLKGYGADFAGQAVGENGVVQWGKGTKENRTRYRDISQNTLEEYIAKNPATRAHITPELYDLWREKAKEYGFK